MMEYIDQLQSRPLVQTKKTVEWLVENTRVAVFDPVRFEGYQRKINDRHCDAIVTYLERNELFLPTSIICALDGKYGDDSQLRVVDGQHRIEAFRRLRDRNHEVFDSIRNKEISVIVLEHADVKTEIETFITINKTPRKVDTSLALVLKNMLNSDNPNEVSEKSKRDYLAVEAARILNEEPTIWEGRISYEGTPSKLNRQLVSLNAFVSNVRSMLRYLGDAGLVSFDWESKQTIDIQAENTAVLLDVMWHAIERKWPELYEGDEGNRRIVQGPIGLASLTRFVCLKLKPYDSGLLDINKLCDLASRWILNIDAPAINWLPGGSYSQFTSGSGYSIIARELVTLCKDD